MLLERAETLAAALRKHLELKAASQQEKVYRTRAGQLKPLADGLLRAQQDWAEMRTAGLVKAGPEVSPSLRAHAEALLARAKADRSVLAEADDAFRFKFETGVRKATGELTAACQAGWAAHTAARADFPAEDVLAALDAIAGYRPQVHRIRDAARDFRKLRESTPAAAELVSALAQVDAAGQQKDEALAAMQGDDLPPAVLNFLRKTGQGGAALSDLSSPVAAWLEARDLSGAFRIVPSGRGP